MYFWTFNLYSYTLAATVMTYPPLTLEIMIYFKRMWFLCDSSLMTKGRVKSIYVLRMNELSPQNSSRPSSIAIRLVLNDMCVENGGHMW